MKVLYTTKEGGYWKPLEIKVPDGDIFALCMPDGRIWDKMIGVDDVTKMTKEEFDYLYNRLAE